MYMSGYCRNKIPYVELRTKSFYSFGVGASHVHEFLNRAVELGYPAIALTDYNMCGSLEFARQANKLSIKAIVGAEVTFTDGFMVALLAKNRIGYANICRILTLANKANRKDPRIEFEDLKPYTEGIVLLTGFYRGKVSALASSGNIQKAKRVLQEYAECFEENSVYVELSRNLVYGDKRLIRILSKLASDIGLPVVATNDAHYHMPERHRLQSALVAIKSNKTIDNAMNNLNVNGEYYLKSSIQMANLFKSLPDALKNTIRISELCTFNLSSDLGYQLPSPDVPDGYTPMTYLRRLCDESAIRRYGSINEKVESRMDYEFSLIDKHNLSGFMLLYREIALMAQEIMVESEISSPEEPLEWRPPGRGRGSSVAMLTGYLIGISHIDPLLYDLTLERFLPENLRVLPDIDLDFPRAIRDKLISRIHERFGPDFAVLTGMITTYRYKGVLSDLGKVFNLPREDVDRLSKQIQCSDLKFLRREMNYLPEFKNRVDVHGWRDLIELSPQLQGAPKGLGQHVGGMILSSSPISQMVPYRSGAIDGRFIMDWDKDSVSNAGFAKIDILSLPVLDQLIEAVNLIEKKTGQFVDISRINLDDAQVYDMINQGRSKGVFLLQSPAQLKMGQRLKSRNLLDLAYQVALIRPGVGTQGSSVSQFVDRYRNGVAWDYDHPLEKRALKRGYGIIIWQEQVVQLISDVSGMSQADSDEIRRAFGYRNNEDIINGYWKKFCNGAKNRGVDEKTAHKIFSKINGHYMFPESHSHAFAISAYQAAWLKYHYPLEFYVSLMNNQPMGFYPIDTIKQDAKNFGIHFLNPCVNMSESDCSIRKENLLLGLKFVKNVGVNHANNIVKERITNGLYKSVSDFIYRTTIGMEALESLVMAGVFDNLSTNRKSILWEVGLYKNSSNSQISLPMDMENEIPYMADFTPYEKMIGEYRSMAIYPKGQIMEFIRKRLSENVVNTRDVYLKEEGESLLVAGWVIARQHPRGAQGAIFVTIEDEFADLQLIIWPHVINDVKYALREAVIIAEGKISRWDGTTNLVVSRMYPVSLDIDMPMTHDWH